MTFESRTIVRTWHEAATAWHSEGVWKADLTRKHERMILERLEHWNALPLPMIDEDLVSTHVRLEVEAGRGVRTVNRMLEVIRAILRASVARKWLQVAPTIRLLRKRPQRLRWLSHSDARRLLKELPDHLRPIVVFSLETGLRKRNVLDLEWSQVDMGASVAWIHADQAKARRAIPVPLSPVAYVTLREQIGRHHRYVFTYRGRRIAETNTKAWRAALERAGIRDFRWHDLRHTWASWHAQAGTPLYILQELGGWSSSAMVKVYAHLSTAHLHEHVHRLHAHVHGKGTVTRMGEDRRAS